jgi:hypothetical protein
MSFTTHPAARIAMLPARNSPASRAPRAASGAASTIDHSPGRNSSQNPIGRSARASSA